LGPNKNLRFQHRKKKKKKTKQKKIYVVTLSLPSDGARHQKKIHTPSGMCPQRLWLKLEKKTGRHDGLAQMSNGGGVGMGKSSIQKGFPEGGSQRGKGVNKNREGATKAKRQGRWENKKGEQEGKGQLCVCKGETWHHGPKANRSKAVRKKEMLGRVGSCFIGK